MSYANRFKRDRSEFYLQIFENEDNITLSANKLTKKLVNRCFDVEKLSPKGWKKSQNYDSIYTLWIPNDWIDEEVINEVICWAEICHSCVWVKLNKNISPFFTGKELKYCICSDWNFHFGNGRTDSGNAEYEIKYNNEYSEENKNIVRDSMKKCLEAISRSLDNVLVTTIPSVKANQNKLSWKLAKFLSKELDADFMTATLKEDKPQMKGLSVEEKLDEWQKIYEAEDMISLIVDEEDVDIDGETILIVDDLYQSGTSMWCYAEWLKSLGAKEVIGIALVKSLKDSDNKS